MNILRIIWGILTDWLLIALWHTEAWIRKPPEKWNEGEKGIIVYVPGWNEHWTWGRKILDELNRLGYRVLICKTVERMRGLKPVAETSQVLGNFLANENLSKVILIGHSKGGLIGQYLMDNLLEAKRVKKMIAIASPFGGTIWCEARVFCLDEMRRSSKLIKDWKVENTSKFSMDQLKWGNWGKRRLRLKTVNIYSTIDPSVLPYGCNKLTGARNIELRIVGHASIMIDEKLIDTIKKEIEIK